LNFLDSFAKNPQTLNENPCSGSKIFPYEQRDRRTDRHDETNSGVYQFWERAQEGVLPQIMSFSKVMDFVGCYYEDGLFLFLMCTV
jgi:hypothetical protein